MTMAGEVPKQKKSDCFTVFNILVCEYATLAVVSACQIIAFAKFIIVDEAAKSGSKKNLVYICYSLQSVAVNCFPWRDEISYSMLVPSVPSIWKHGPLVWSVWTWGWPSLYWSHQSTWARGFPIIELLSQSRPYIRRAINVSPFSFALLPMFEL
ncbi:hypothetical protein BC830DRAFT_118509 [Chytriomyces sp. MP71]|nr:hypothetical protein BC830DRAFT_118509 [Chytriomyces sp. MP71]